MILEVAGSIPVAHPIRPVHADHSDQTDQTDDADHSDERTLNAVWPPIRQTQDTRSEERASRCSRSDEVQSILGERRRSL